MAQTSVAVAPGEVPTGCGTQRLVRTSALLFAIIGAILLGTIQQASSVAYTTSGARVGDPGNNLIGPN